MPVKEKSPNRVDMHIGNRVRMRRMMLSMSQDTVGHALGLTFQQVQKYEKGANRIGADRLRQISGIVHVPVPVFLEGAPTQPGGLSSAFEASLSPAYVADFFTASDGLAPTKVFVRIKNAKLRKRIVDLAVQIAFQ